MPEVDEYLRLKEMDALLTQAKLEATLVENELNRLKRRESEKAEREIQLNTLKQEAKDLAHKIADLDRQLTQRLSPETIQKLEEDGLALLVRQQELENQIEDSKSFLSGFEKTLQDIHQETADSISQHTLLKEQYLTRAKALEAELTEEWKRAYKKAQSKNLAHGVFSRIENGHCYFCRGAISRPIESEVEAQLLLKACPSCDRLFLPHKAVYG